jgi:predicted dithiol-disulfide oxidoreductase (DUF899 family)
VSSNGSDFNYDYQASHTPEAVSNNTAVYNYGAMEYPMEETHGISVFYKDDSGQMFHTYSSYARGCDMLVTTYNYLDLAPKGRDEEALEFTMAWVRHHDRYDAGYQVDANAGYHAPEAVES